MEDHPSFAAVWSSSSRLLRVSDCPTRDTKCPFGCHKSILPEVEGPVSHLRKIHVLGKKGPSTSSQVPDLEALVPLYRYWYCVAHDEYISTTCSTRFNADALFIFQYTSSRRLPPTRTPMYAPVSSEKLDMAG